MEGDTKQVSRSRSRIGTLPTIVLLVLHPILSPVTPTPKAKASTESWNVPVRRYFTFTSATHPSHLTSYTAKSKNFSPHPPDLAFLHQLPILPLPTFRGFQE